ncbi:MAG: glycosyltransferase family 4 protein [Candidatus Magasanikbacteria bacterium]|nr:glycosyltransferase family 4 protein [Candidatus Magasanikbacteria bacterium]
MGKDAAKIKSVLDKYSLSQPYFLSLGRLEEKKNTAGLVLAFNLFKSRLKANGGGGKGNGKEFSLVLLGKPGYGFERVRETIAKSEFKKDIFLPGWAAQADVPYLMAGATAFIFPSFYEGFGIPVLEAMASGVPVICSGVSSLPEVAGGAALLVNPYKPEEIAEAMRIIISEISLRGALIAKGLERVKNFDWQKTARGVWEEVRGLSPISLQKRI